jgi:hypothetical protein
MLSFGGFAQTRTGLCFLLGLWGLATCGAPKPTSMLDPPDDGDGGTGGKSAGAGGAAGAGGSSNRAAAGTGGAGGVSGGGGGAGTAGGGGATTTTDAGSAADASGDLATEPDAAFSAPVDASFGSIDKPPAGPQNPMLSFKNFTIGRPGGRLFGQTSLVDIDKDGDLDFVTGARGGNAYWFEYKSASSWVQHTIGGPTRTDVGGSAFDIDGDGWLDHVAGADWYRNTGNPRGAPFQKYPNGAQNNTHDTILADLDGDGKPDPIYAWNTGLVWYKIPRDPKMTWAANRVSSSGFHGGVAAGDIDGDGDIDLTLVTTWYENVNGKGTEWRARRAFDFGRAGPYGTQTKAQLVDLDGDGDLDLVQTEGDIRGGRIAWFENRDGKGGSWTRHIIKAPGHTQDFHTLAVADFDDDGDLDIFSCGGPLTSGTPTWSIWQNLDGKAATWKEQEIFRGVECHEGVAGDVDRDGDIDIASKPWDGDHHVYLQNQLKP